MRDKSDLKEYMQKYRFCKILNRMKEKRVKCEYCDKTLETLHHKDEDHSNNRLTNLIPVCQVHHLEIIHKSDIIPQNMPNFASFKAQKAVTQPKTTDTILQNCNNGRIYNLTIMKPDSKRKINIIEGSLHLLEFLGSLGYVLQ